MYYGMADHDPFSKAFPPGSIKVDGDFFAPKRDSRSSWHLKMQWIEQTDYFAADSLDPLNSYASFALNKGPQMRPKASGALWSQGLVQPLSAFQISPTVTKLFRCGRGRRLRSGRRRTAQRCCWGGGGRILRSRWRARRACW